MKVSEEKVFEAICQGLDKMKEKVRQELASITSDINDGLNENEGDIIDKTINGKTKLKIDPVKGLIDVTGAIGWTCARGGSFNAGNVIMGELLPGFEEAETGQGQGRGMHDGSSPEDQMSNLNQEPDEE